MINDEFFYLVWNPHGSNPSHRHDTEKYAVEEAERLATQKPGTEFFVLKATHRCAVERPVITTKLTKQSVPF